MQNATENHIQKVQIIKTTKVRCAICGKKLPPVQGEVKPEQNFCPECLEIAKRTGYKNPKLALGLSIIPGLGYLYVESYKMALITFVGTIIGLFIPIVGWLWIIGLYLFSFAAAPNKAELINKVKENQIQ